MVNIINNMENPNVSINEKTNWGIHRFKDGQEWSCFKNCNGFWVAINPLKAQPSKTKSDIIVVKE
jgi:hypothetical protein